MWEVLSVFPAAVYELSRSSSARLLDLLLDRALVADSACAPPTKKELNLKSCVQLGIRRRQRGKLGARLKPRSPASPCPCCRVKGRKRKKNAADDGISCLCACDETAKITFPHAVGAAEITTEQHGPKIRAHESSFPDTPYPPPIFTSWSDGSRVVSA